METQVLVDQKTLFILYKDTGCCPEDLLWEMDEWDGWRERDKLKGFRAMMMMMIIMSFHKSQILVLELENEIFFITSWNPRYVRIWTYRMTIVISWIRYFNDSFCNKDFGFGVLKRKKLLRAAMRNTRCDRKLTSKVQKKMKKTLTPRLTRNIS